MTWEIVAQAIGVTMLVIGIAGAPIEPLPAIATYACALVAGGILRNMPTARGATFTVLAVIATYVQHHEFPAVWRYGFLAAFVAIAFAARIRLRTDASLAFAAVSGAALLFFA
jgi:hypothetical protein